MTTDTHQRICRAVSIAARARSHISGAGEQLSGVSADLGGLDDAEAPGVLECADGIDDVILELNALDSKLEDLISRLGAMAP